MENEVNPPGSRTRKHRGEIRQPSRPMAQGNEESRTEEPRPSDANESNIQAAAERESGRPIEVKEVAEEIVETVLAKGQQLGNEAADVSKRLSSRFIEYTEKDPPKAALTCLAIGTVVGVLLAAAFKD